MSKSIECFFAALLQLLLTYENRIFTQNGSWNTWYFGLRSSANSSPTSSKRYKNFSVVYCY